MGRGWGWGESPEKEREKMEGLEEKAQSLVQLGLSCPLSLQSARAAGEQSEFRGKPSALGQQEPGPGTGAALLRFVPGTKPSPIGILRPPWDKREEVS